jgi:hypothetical protein
MEAATVRRLKDAINQAVTASPAASPVSKYLSFLLIIKKLRQNIY